MPGGIEHGDQWYGKGFDSFFPEGSSPKTTPPFPRAAMRKDRGPYDEAPVHEAIRKNPPDLVDIDTRGLRSTQPWVTRPGVEHYMGDKYQTGGETYADPHNIGNRFPVVYEREEEGNTTRMLLSGHHRATAAHLQGKPLRGIVVKGGYGAETKPWSPPERTPMKLERQPPRSRHLPPIG